MNGSSWWGLPCFRVIYFPETYFFFKFYQNLLQLPECFTHVTGSSTVCIMMEKCLRATTIGPRLRCVYFVVYKCMSFCSLNRIGYVQWTGWLFSVFVYRSVHTRWGLCVFIRKCLYVHTMTIWRSLPRWFLFLNSWIL